ncbi:FapA family protein [Calditerrivibrio sp.]|uniref:FapA family protein n=1 Tax=Calditerrivibrio sp. TaxID=2792612 RepID=UPI003D0B5797
MDSQFLSRYDIKDFLISLPSGDLYKAIDIKFKRNVLIKIVDLSNIKEISDIENIKNRFIRYVNNALKLIHPNIVNILDYHIDENNKCYTVTEYFNINDSIFSKEMLFDMSFNAKLKIATSLVEAIEFAHNIKILHQNLYIDSVFFANGNIKIDNFDLKRYLAKNSLISELGIYSNPPPYIPPEYISSYEPSVYGDIFQIGCILYFIFCREHPFGDTINDEAILRIKNLDYIDPTYYSDVDIDIAKIINRALMKKPSERFETVNQMFIELKKIIEKLKDKKYDISTYRFFIQNNKMYIQTNPTTHIDISELENRLLNENIFNYDLDRIQEAIHISNGEPIEIGEVFKKIDSAVFNYFDISVSDDQMECYLKKLTPKKLDPKEILFYLKKKNIRYGYIKENISELAEDAEGSIRLVARGAEPIKGEDAYLVFFFEPENKYKPKEDDEGNVDFRNISVIQQVDKGDPLVIKVPATKGVDGYNVFGNIIKATPGNDVKLPTGKNVYLSSDGLKILSTTDGIVNYDNGKVNVIEMIVIDGDVNFSTGNINYKGDVLIRGDVLPDFKVFAGGDIKIRGVVEGAFIESERGSVIISSGVFGKNQTKIKALKNIKADFVQDAELFAGETVEITNYTRNSKVFCKSFLSYKGMGAVQSSLIEATQLIDINIAGAKNYTKTTLYINQLNKNNLKLQIQDIMEKLDTISKSINQLKLQIKKIIVSSGSMENAILDTEYKACVEKLKKLDNLNLVLQEKLQSLQDDMNFILSEQKEMIIIRRYLYSDVKIRIGSALKITKDEYETRVVIIKDEKDELVLGSAVSK